MSLCALAQTNLDVNSRTIHIIPIEQPSEALGMALCQTNHILPITATAYVHVGGQRILMIGEGPFVKIFCLIKLSLQCQIKIFESQAIHGIVCYESADTAETRQILCLIWGGRSITFAWLIIEDTGISLRECPRKWGHSEWLLDAIFFDNEGRRPSKVVLLDCCNEIYSLDCPRMGDSIHLSGMNLTSRGPPSSLYTGKIKISQGKSILVAAGTVFGGVHLWTVELIGQLESPGRLVAVYSGHEGSVFGITFANYGIDSGVVPVIASCSDDRTFKLWPVPQDLQANKHLEPSAAQQTGFERLDTNQIVIPPLTSASGHMSRIWKIDSFFSIKESSIITFGEDATAQLWSIRVTKESDQISVSKGALLNLHAGKSIWTALVTDSDIDFQPALITGGADGRITLTDLAKYRQCQFTGFPSSIGSFIPSALSIRAYCWLDHYTLLAIDCNGNIYLGHAEVAGGISNITWQDVSSIPGLARYALVTSVGSNYALLADHTGSLFLFTRADISVTLLSRLERKISFVYGTEIDTNSSFIVEFSLVFQCLGSSELHVGKFDLSIPSNEITDFSFNKVDLPSSFVATCTKRLSKTMIAVGSRGGDIAVVRSNADGTIEGYDILHLAHEEEAVTSISILESISDSGHWILNTGRDGCFKVHRIGGQDTDSHPITVHSTKLPFGPDIEGAEMVNGQVHVWGFRSTDLVLWNHSTQQELFSMDCGGNHRSWSFFHGPVSALAWTRVGKPHIAQLQCGTRLLQQGSHGREIKAVAIRQNSDALGAIIATGAEDTCIRLSSYTEQNKFTVLEVLPNHTTGLQKLAWSKDGRYLFSAAGKEEFYVWQVSAIPILQIGVKMIAAAPTVTDSQILRIMDFDIIEDKEYRIIMVYSDSSIRLWKYNPIDGAFQMLREALYTTCCLTQCKVLDSIVVTAATDGHLIMWNLSDLTQLSRKQIHQSSIKSLDATIWNDKIVVTTGGDDNALAITVLESQTQLVWSSLIIPKAHAAAINTVMFMSVMGNRLEVVTASSDQRLLTWTFSLSAGDGIRTKISARRGSNLPSSVADANCMAIMQMTEKSNVVIAGVGTEIWSVTSEKQPSKLDKII